MAESLDFPDLDREEQIFSWSVQHCYDYINLIWKAHGLYINHGLSLIHHIERQ